MKVSNSEGFQPMIVYILIYSCLKMLNEYLEYFILILILTILKTVIFMYSISCCCFPFLQRNIYTQLTTVHSFVCL